MMLGARPTMLEQLFGGNNNALGGASCRLSKINMGAVKFLSEKNANGFEDICCEGGEQQQKTRLCEVWWRDPKGIHQSCCLFEESPEGVEVETRCKTCQRCSTNLDSEGATASVRPVYDGYKRWRDIETKVFL